MGFASSFDTCFTIFAFLRKNAEISCIEFEYFVETDENQIGSQRGPDHNIATTPSVYFPTPVSSTEMP